MDIGEIHQLRELLQIPADDLVETHISWVLLSEHLVYKIKKPVKFSFLDFSTLEKRLYCCQREVELNRRLTSDMYLGVVPIRRSGQGIHVETGTGEILDYAVKMRRQPAERQMDVLLQAGEVTERHMDQIAGVLSEFHRYAGVPSQRPDPDRMLQDFADLKGVIDTIHTVLGRNAEVVVLRAIGNVDRFLKRHATRIDERYDSGFFIDGHGDLHSKNIFLLDNPVIYDCIEFNDHFRHIDVLDELAFFCLDLEFYRQNALASYFLDSYLSLYACMLTDQDTDLFKYFQLYRAGVKLKINLLKVSGASSDTRSRIEKVRGYYRLFCVYLDALDQGSES